MAICRIFPGLLSLLLLPLLLLGTAHGQAWKSQVGYNDWVARHGGTAPHTGAGLNVAVAEALVGGHYLADGANAELVGKTIIDGSGTATGTSGHATGVARNLMGSTVGMANGISTITGFDANDYINRVLGAAGTADPLADAFDISNHSYIGNGVSAADKVIISQRLDFVINRDDMLAVVGTNNTSTNTTPDLLAPSFNAITVGRTDGNHARGLTTEYGTPRFKPDIVAPLGTVSSAVPIVSGAAAILKNAGRGTQATRNETIKAMLFAGATKSEFPDWDRTTTRPIDEVFGFGELNILNSYEMLKAGEYDGSTSDPATNIGKFGYDFGSFNGTDDLFYDFEVSHTQTRLSAALVWNAVVTDADASSAVFDASVTLANLDLELYDSSGTFLGSLIDSSLSTDYNLEHIFVDDLAAGQYTFRITGDSAADFGFAWSAVPEPSGGLLAGLLLLSACCRRRRRV